MCHNDNLFDIFLTLSASNWPSLRSIADTPLGQTGYSTVAASLFLKLFVVVAGVFCYYFLLFWFVLLLCFNCFCKSNSAQFILLPIIIIVKTDLIRVIRCFFLIRLRLHLGAIFFSSLVWKKSNGVITIPSLKISSETTM